MARDAAPDNAAAAITAIKNALRLEPYRVAQSDSV
jgi:hypothetical protein